MGCVQNNRRWKPLKGCDQELVRRTGEKNVESRTHKGETDGTWCFVLKMEAAGSSTTSVT
jgi:hypothetical protein